MAPPSSPNEVAASWSVGAQGDRWTTTDAVSPPFEESELKVKYPGFYADLKHRDWDTLNCQCQAANQLQSARNERQIMQVKQEPQQEQQRQQQQLEYQQRQQMLRPLPPIDLDPGHHRVLHPHDAKALSLTGNLHFLQVHEDAATPGRLVPSLQPPPPGFSFLGDEPLPHGAYMGYAPRLSEPKCFYPTPRGEPSFACLWKMMPASLISAETLVRCGFTKQKADELWHAWHVSEPNPEPKLAAGVEPGQAHGTEQKAETDGEKEREERREEEIKPLRISVFVAHAVAMACAVDNQIKSRKRKEAPSDADEAWQGEYETKLREYGLREDIVLSLLRKLQASPALRRHTPRFILSWQVGRKAGELLALQRMSWQRGEEIVQTMKGLENEEARWDMIRIVGFFTWAGIDGVHENFGGDGDKMLRDEEGLECRALRRRPFKLD